MKPAFKKLQKGFTLIEVVIALAVFAFLIGGLLGFLPWSVEGVSKVREQDTAYGLVDGVQVELERMGFSMVEAGTTRLAQLYNALMPPRISDVKYDVLVFFSPTGITSLYENFPDFVQKDTRIAAFGSTTIKAVKNNGLILDVEVPNKKFPSMSMALDDYITKANKRKRSKK